jgi:FKBP-type peptidyl-prolyl cis-trans isomerase (trigger factor)
MNPTFTNVSVESLPQSRVRMNVTIPALVVASFETEAISELKETISVDGFRPGTAPDDMIRAKLGAAKLFEECAIRAVSAGYATLLIEQKIEAISRPAIVFKKLAPGNDVDVAIETDILPEMKLPDVDAIAKKVFGEAKPTSVTDEDVEKGLLEIRQMRAHQKMHEDNIEHHSHDHAEIAESDLPALDDEFAKSLGAFVNVDELRAKIRQNLQEEQVARGAQVARAAFLDAIRTELNMDVPQSLVAGELAQMMAQFSHDLAMAGQDLNEYLKATGMTKEQLEDTWKEHAMSRVQNHLILEEIAREKKIEPSDEDVETEAANLMQTIAGAPDVSESRVRLYVTEMLRNKMIFEYFEKK